MCFKYFRFGKRYTSNTIEDIIYDIPPTVTYRLVNETQQNKKSITAYITIILDKG